MSAVSTNPHFERALLLYQQSRHDMAEAELRQALAAEPQAAGAHALLALCLAKREQFQEASGEAQQAIHLQPDLPFPHYANACVLYERHRFDEALPAIQEAIRLDSTDPDYFWMLAAIHFQERRWRDALQASEQGLQSDPEHVGCMNLRAMAMVKLGQKTEASEAINAALAKNPGNALTHANQGWTLLEHGDPGKALEHFREALRLDPENEWARQGIVEALKARHIVYALMLKYFLWISRFSRRGQWMIILAGYFGNRLLGVVASTHPDLAPWILPVRILYVGFALMTWLASPFFNLLLRMNRFGRLALSPEEKTASDWLGLCLLCCLVALVNCILFGFDSAALIALIVFGFLLIPVSAVYKCEPGRPRFIMATLVIILAVTGLVVVILFVAETGGPVANAQRDMSAADGLLGIFLIGAVASTWVTNILGSQRRKR